MSVGLLQVQSKTKVVATPAINYDLNRQIVLFILCLVWFFPGTIDRGMWKPEETTLIPIAYESFSEGWTTKLTQQGEVYTASQSLYLYLAASISKLFGDNLRFHAGMRLLNILWLGLGFVLVGYLIGRRHGNRAGWRAILLMMGSLGLLLHARTVNPDITLVLYSASGLLALYLIRIKHLLGGLLLGLTAAIGFWTVGVIVIWYCLVIAVLPVLFNYRHVVRKFNAGHFLAFIITFLAVGLWFQSISDDPRYVIQFNQSFLASFQAANLITNLQKSLISALWITWPSLPFAAIAYIHWLYQREDQVEIPIGLIGIIAGFIALILASNDRETAVFILLAPAAVMATVSIHGLSKEIAKMLDWFAVLVIGGGMIGFFWIAWIAFKLGSPVMLITWLNSVGITSSTSDLSVVFAILSSIAWIAMMIRIGRSPDRAVLNWMVGITMAWLVFTILWMKPLDQAKSYENLAASLQEAITNLDECIIYSGINADIINQLSYLSNIHITRENDNITCKYRLIASAEQPELEYLWTGSRSPDDADEEIGLLLNNY